MKTLIFTNSALYLNTALSIQEHCEVAGIVIPEELNYELLGTIAYAENRGIPLLKIAKSDLEQGGKVASWIQELQVEAVLVMTFPFIIPEHLLKSTEKGFFNVHFSKLPSYKGSAPLFWQMKNGAKETGLTIHRMTTNVDSGPMVFRQELQLYPGENYGLAKARLTALLGESMPQILERIKAEQYLYVGDEDIESSFHIPEINDLTINWDTHTATEIEHLVNAANPLYQGAITYIGGQQVRIFEVTSVTGEFDPAQVAPGTVFHIDPEHGPMVLTSDKSLLLLNVVGTMEGIFSGKKMCAIGLKVGDQFITLS
ncbi:methionyl-tRNA formyltransferase [Pedobacter gandavensis]|uniref:Methionyl-tRNA formyltransferase n=1 Tax=Pedobacter gandavensis TaxID=2679963 RepID=A0ABR6EY25_9SPHI|nr:formyltransferase family protein [Pedobacter gandavensis]MBB2149937.1 hypothetical protein [Pedobacter gandavensis]